MQQEDLTQIILVSFMMPVLLSALLIWFFISFQRRKHRYETEKKDAMLREQALVIQRQEAVQAERNRIAGEMHDELGSGLTLIKYLSDSIGARVTDSALQEDVGKIAGYSSGLVRNMSEIIWAMNSRFDNLEGLISYVRRFVSEYLDDRGIEHRFVCPDVPKDVTLTVEKRRNVFLVIKETIHNAVKYSGAEAIRVKVSFGDSLDFLIEELGGRGFDPADFKDKGNGLYNMQKRMELVGGSIRYERRPEAMCTHISLPLEKQPTGTLKTP